MAYVQGYTNSANYCPYCGKEVYEESVNVSQTCGNPECNKSFFVIEDED